MSYKLLSCRADQTFDATVSSAGKASSSHACGPPWGKRSLACMPWLIYVPGSSWHHDIWWVSCAWMYDSAVCGTPISVTNMDLHCVQYVAFSDLDLWEAKLILCKSVHTLASSLMGRCLILIAACNCSIDCIIAITYHTHSASGFVSIPIIWRTSGCKQITDPSFVDGCDHTNS